jgi:N-acetylglucosaminyldiphosphoundecaprenol N-acetyl-beta-D-mannosaminyltransferase
MIADAHRNPVFARQVSAAHLVLADGMPVARAFGWLYGIRQDRIAGMDFMPSVIAAANVKVYLFGSRPETLRMITQRIGREYPNLEISGAFSPPFGKWTAESNETYIENIRNSGAQIVLVSLGCPKQETWTAQH